MTLTFLRWSPKMQQHRRILQNPFTKPKVVQYKSLQTKEAHQAVKGMMQNPLQWELELKRFAIAIVFITYELLSHIVERSSGFVSLIKSLRI